MYAPVPCRLNGGVYAESSFKEFQVGTLQVSRAVISVIDLHWLYFILNLSDPTVNVMHSKAIGIVHRILCYQKRYKIRLVYNWKELWSGEMHVLSDNIISLSYAVCAYGVAMFVIVLPY